MSWLQNVFGRFASLWRYRRPYELAYVEDQPDDLKKGVVYLVGDRSWPWSAALLCPCGCGAQIRLSLIPTDKPRWEIHFGGDGNFTLHPSIWRTKDCRAHFFVRRSRIVWVPSTSRQLFGLRR